VKAGPEVRLFAAVLAGLYHDLMVDAQRSFQALLQWQRLIPETDLPQSKVEIITPYNLP